MDPRQSTEQHIRDAQAKDYDKHQDRIRSHWFVIVRDLAVRRALGLHPRPTGQRHEATGTHSTVPMVP
jgi:hypothetical protein